MMPRRDPVKDCATRAQTPAPVYAMMIPTMPETMVAIMVRLNIFLNCILLDMYVKRVELYPVQKKDSVYIRIMAVNWGSLKNFANRGAQKKATI